MKCEICGNEYDGVFCNKCGWEEMNILDDEYLKIFEKRKEIYKKKINDSKFSDFMEELIKKYNVYLKENLNLAKVFIDDILEILKNFDKNYYMEFLMAKFYIYIKEKNKEAKNLLNELESLSDLMNEKQKESFEKLKAFYDKSF
jgi:hypothetical protein